jgi:hypothetical protein
MLRRHRDTLAASGGELALGALLWLFARDPFTMAAWAVVTALVVGSLAWRGSHPESPANPLFPRWLLTRPTAPAVGLFALAQANVVLCFAAGERFGQTYPDTTHNNLFSLLSSTCGWLTVVGGLALLRRHPVVRDFAVGTPRDRSDGVSLNVALGFVGLYLPSQLGRDSLTASHPLLAWEPYLSCAWLLVVIHLVMAMAMRLVAFAASRRRVGWLVFERRDLWLLEPAMLNCLALGLFSRPDEPQFASFIACSALGVTVIAALMELMGVEPNGIRLTRPIHLPRRALFMALNTAAFVLVTAARYRLLLVAASAGVVTVWLAGALVAATAPRWRAERQARLAIAALNARPTRDRDTDWFDRKVAAYHALREAGEAPGG